MSVIQEVKARLDIVDVIGQYVQLQKAGQRFKALCPFHSEKEPSFTVSPERQSWHCFGACGTGGDVFSFIMKREGLEFGQALHLLAEKAGLTLPQWKTEKEDDAESERLRQANEAAAQFYHHLLLNTEQGRLAREYIEGRGIDAKTAQEFLLGYSPSGRDALRQYLGQRGFSDQELVGAGLVVESESGPRDRFRHRLMFPIQDEKGRAIGFGARALPTGRQALDDSPSASSGQSLPKYLNTAQTRIFDKGGLLYALDKARNHIRQEGRAVIVEGYMDAIAAHQHGFGNVVASMGTALTERQVRLLKRYTRNLVLALDADVAGSEAALRSQDVLEEALAASAQEEREVMPVLTWRGLVRYQESVAVDLRVAVLPQGRDPDDVIREDAEAWRRLTEGAQPVLDYRFQVVAAGTDASDPRARSQAVRQLLPLVGAIADPVVRAHYVQRLARLALVREEELMQMLARLRGSPRSSSGRAVEPEAGGTSPQSRSDAREEFLLALLLRYPSLREQGLAMAEELLWSSESREVLRAWRRHQDEESLREELLPELQPHLDRILRRRLPSYDEKGAEAAFIDCLRRLEKRQLEVKKQASTAALAAQEGQAADVLGAVEAARAILESGGQELVLSGEAISEVAALEVADMEAGWRLHGVEKKRGGESGPSEGGTGRGDS